MAKRRSQTDLPLAQVELDQLVRLCAALGASDVGGPLSASERATLSRAKRLPAPTKALVRDTRKAIRAGRDPLGEWFCRIRSPLERRPQGAFYTQPTLVDPMVAWVQERDPSRVVDAGCGSGRFAAAFVRQNRSIEVIAVDLDPVATLTTRAALSCMGARRATVLQQDYTRLELPAIGGPTAFIGNPPYVRHHDLAPEVKDWARSEARDQGLRHSALAGLHAYFYLATARMARDGDLGCFVTSAEWLDVGYGRIIRNLLAGPLGGVCLHVLSPEAIVFDDAMTTAAIACFEVGGKHRSMRMKTVSKASDVGKLDRGRPIRRDRLATESRWTEVLRRRQPSGTAQTALREVARVHRGVVTGSNQFFVMTRRQALDLGIAKFCRPVIASAKQILGADGSVRVRDAIKVVLDLDSSFDPSTHAALHAYLESGRRRGVDRGYVASHRTPWWRIGISAPPPIVASYMARQPPVFALNPDGLVLLNIAHGIYPTKPMSKQALGRLVTALNDNRHRYKGAGRTYHGGLEKFEPREMEALSVPSASLA